MFIQVQDTPNPNTLKFILDEAILQGSQTFNYNNKDEANDSLLAQKLFDINGISNIFIGYNFVSVSIADGYSWDSIKHKVMGYLNDFLTTGAKVVNPVENNETQKVVASSESEQEIVDKIAEIIEERVRPAVAMDGGDIIFKKYENGVVYLEMLGACSGCPSSTMTLKSGIENMLKYYIPEVQEVVSIE
jgi:Fe-S cluster biogenesis protein NfuA